MNFKSTFWALLNIFARIFGLTFTAFGMYFAIQGIYYLVQPDVANVNDTLGFSPSFRPFVIACILLVVGVHFIRGEAHRPDAPEDKQSSHSTDGRTLGWWTGEPLNSKSFSLPVSVADTEAGPDINWSRYHLSVSFTTYQNVRVSLEFDDVPHFEFRSDVEIDPAVFHDDGAVEILNSPIIKKLVEVGEFSVEESSEYKHIAIGFNEIGSNVSIVFKNMRCVES
jgi:hypothetical protein